MPHELIAPLPAPSDEPSPSATPEQVGVAARIAILEALQILDHAGTPLAALLAQQARSRPDRLLQAAARFAPASTKVELGDSLRAMHLQALRALAAVPVTIIEHHDPRAAQRVIEATPVVDIPGWAR